MSVEIIGFIAGAFIAVAFIPQLLRLFKLKSAKEISLPFTLLFILGNALWIFYGVSLQLTAVIFWNAIMVVLLTIMIYAKFKYGGSYK